MYEITVKRHFSAAHTLQIGGTHENLHGHNFTVEVTLSSKVLDEEGLVVDFRLLKRWTDDILEGLDHTFINELGSFKDTNPTSENMARFIYEKIFERVHGKRYGVEKVTVWESESAKATYRGGEHG